MRVGVIIAVCSVVLSTAAISMSHSTNQPARQNLSHLRVQHGPIIYVVAQITGSNLEPILRACAKLRQVSHVRCDSSSIIPYSVRVSKFTNREGLYGVGFDKKSIHGEATGRGFVFLVDLRKSEIWLAPNI